jgi:CheY-like chemotaxis protein
MERWDVQIPIIAMTVNTIREDRIFCLASGSEHYLSKFVQLY